jgi:hypothetical protein
VTVQIILGCDTLTLKMEAVCTSEISVSPLQDSVLSQPRRTRPEGSLNVVSVRDIL